MRGQVDWLDGWVKQPRECDDTLEFARDNLPSSFDPNTCAFIYLRAPKAYRKDGKDEWSGKWLVFQSTSWVDDAWLKLAEALKEGKLGPALKVPPTGGRGSAERVPFFVYKKDFTDETDVLRVGKALREVLKITRMTIAYKPDVITRDEGPKLPFAKRPQLPKKEKRDTTIYQLKPDSNTLDAKKEVYQEAVALAKEERRMFQAGAHAGAGPSLWNHHDDEAQQMAQALALSLADARQQQETKKRAHMPAVAELVGNEDDDDEERQLQEAIKLSLSLP